MGCSQPSRLTPERAPAVVERFDVEVHDPICTAIHALSHLLTGLVGTAFRPEPVRTVSEVGFENWFQNRLRGCLAHAISDRRDGDFILLQLLMSLGMRADGRSRRPVCGRP